VAVEVSSRGRHAVGAEALHAMQLPKQLDIGVSAKAEQARSTAIRQNLMVNI